MRVQHSEQKIDVVGRLRNCENPLVNLFVRHGGSVLWRIRERDAQGQFFCNEIDCAQPHCKLLQKTSQHEKEWLGCFNLIFKFEALFK